MTNWHSYWKWPIEIVDLPIDSMMIFQFAMLNYQRVHGTVNNNGIEWKRKNKKLKIEKGFITTLVEFSVLSFWVLIN